MNSVHSRDGRRIIVSDYDPRWALQFEELRTHIWPHVAHLAVTIEHVGSTSVKGLAAKPVIDMDIVVSDEKKLALAIQALGSLGYAHRGELGVLGRHAFSQPATGLRHHLYVCLDGSLGLRNHTALRDFLRANPQSIAEYSALKRRLADAHGNDISAYVEGKTKFIVEILSKQGFTDTEIAYVINPNLTDNSRRYLNQSNGLLMSTD